MPTSTPMNDDRCAKYQREHLANLASKQDMIERRLEHAIRFNEQYITAWIDDHPYVMRRYQHA
jgi:hypothetical protein